MYESNISRWRVFHTHWCLLLLFVSCGFAPHPSYSWFCCSPVVLFSAYCLLVLRCCHYVVGHTTTILLFSLIFILFFSLFFLFFFYYFLLLFPCVSDTSVALVLFFMLCFVPLVAVFFVIAMPFNRL